MSKSYDLDEICCMDLGITLIERAKPIIVRCGPLEEDGNRHRILKDLLFIFINR